MTIWFTADTHFGHASIVQYCNRPFASFEEMDETMILNWNAMVKPEDQVWHLGDFAFKNAEAIFNQLNGTKHLIVGNHDDSAVLKLPWASIQDYAEMKIEGKFIVLFHYPIAAWNKKFHGSYHFYGHTHNTLHLGTGALDVGVDCFGFAPVKLESAAYWAARA